MLFEKIGSPSCAFGRPQIEIVRPLSFLFLRITNCMSHRVASLCLLFRSCLASFVTGPHHQHLHLIHKPLCSTYCPQTLPIDHLLDQPLRLPFAVQNSRTEIHHRWHRNGITCYRKTRRSGKFTNAPGTLFELSRLHSRENAIRNRFAQTTPLRSLSSQTTNSTIRLQYTGSRPR